MPTYYFNLCDKDQIVDSEGTELPDIDAARTHANRVARELMFKSDGLLDHAWSNWSMSVRDDAGVEVFSFTMSDVKRERVE